MKNVWRTVQHAALVTIMTLAFQQVHGQSADFTSSLVDDQFCGGTTVDFTIVDETNITSVHWEFGNGEPDYIDTFTANGSGVDASTTFTGSGTYFVTLTVNGGNDFTLPITINEIPAPTFEVNDGSNEGCLNPDMTVNFDYTGTADIDEWTYNFGDGTTQTYTSGNGDVSHTYTEPGVYNVFLTVLDDNGCSQATIEPFLVKANSTPVSDFSIGTPASCDLPIAVTFTDESTDAQNNISFHSWTVVRDPGGANETVATRSEANPTILFNDFDTYEVTLEVTTSPAECSSTSSQSFTLVENTVSFTPIAATESCVGQSISFANTSTEVGGAPTDFLWDFGDGNTSTDEDPDHSYSTQGQYDVSLTVTFADGCQQTLLQTDLITINANLGASITADVTPAEYCEPTTVNFTASPATGVLYEWDFDYDGSPNITYTSASNTASFEYSTGGDYSIYLRTTSASGCTEEVIESDFVQISGPAPAFVVGMGQEEGCVGEIAEFDASSTVNTLPSGNAGISSYHWDFDGDGNEDATGITASYGYPDYGQYDVTLRVVTDAGCEASVTYSDFISRGIQPTASFNFTNPGQCSNSEFTFNNTSTNNTTPITAVTWNFDDGTELESLSASVNHTYTDDTQEDMTPYNVTLAVSSYGCISTTNTSVDVNYPVARFEVDGNDYTCLNQPSTETINFNAFDGVNLSEGVEEYRWEFGDGSVEPASGYTTGSNPSTTHDYTVSGDYTATLYVTNGNGCEDSYSSVINVSIGTVGFTVDQDDICYTSDEVTFTNTSTTNTSGSVTYEWDFGVDAEPATYTGANPPAVSYSSPGFKTISLTQTESHGCVRTVTETDLIEAEGPISDFDFTSTNSDNNVQCLDPMESMSFTNNALANGTGNSNVSWSWDFGDGASPATSTIVNPGTVTYSSTGQKTITLTVEDNEGCAHTIDRTEFISVPNPVAAFSTNDTEYCTGDDVNFTNNSTENVLNSITSWSWDFGNGASPASSTSENPGAVQYSSVGEKTIELTVTTAAGCIDVISNTIDVYEANASFTPSSTELGCAPALASFTDTSVDVVAWEWDFGDQFGSTSNQQNPEHIYFYPGVYEVTLTTTSAGGCQETSASETISVDGPYYTTFTHGTSGCLNEDGSGSVDLTFNVTGLVETASLLLDWGDGTSSYTQMNGNDFSVDHSYTIVGEYRPKLTLNHTGECGTYVYESSEVVIVSQDPTPSFTSEVISGNGCQDSELQFFDRTQLDGGLNDSRYPITNWLWEFGDNANSTSTDQNPTFIYDDEVGDIDVTLTVSTEFGCEESVTETIHIEPSIVDGTVATDQTVCSGEVPSTLDADDNPSAGDELNYDFLWEESSNEVDWLAAPGTNDQEDYTPQATTPSVQNTRYFRRMVTSGPCEFFSDVFEVTTDPTSDGGTLSADETVCYGTNEGTLVLADEVGEVVKWQYSSTSDFSSDINDIANTNNTHSFEDLTVTTYYRVEVKSGVCTSAFSNIVEVEVLPEITGNSLATDLEACEGVDPGTITATVAGGGEGMFTYMWQSSADDVTYTDLGVTSASYDPGTSLTESIYLRRQVVSNGNCTVFSNSMYVSVSQVADAGDDQTTASLTTSLAANVSEFSGDDAGTWSVQSQPTGSPVVGFDDVNDEDSGVSNLVPGDYTFRWTVDNGSCSTFDDVDITIEPTIEISVTPSSVGEESGTPLVYTFTSNGAIDTPLTINYTLSGDASHADYDETLGGSVVLLADETTVDVTATPTSDDDIETDEDLTITVASGTGYVVGATDEATGTITDDDDDNVVMVLTKDRDGTEDGTTLRYRITLHDTNSSGDVLTNRTGSNISCTITYSEGTAVAADFASLSSQTVSVSNGNNNRTRTRSVFDDDLIELTEGITAQLSGASGPAGVTVSVDATVVAADVIDNDAPVASLEIEATQDGVEGGDNVEFSVKLTDGAGTDLTNATGAAFTGTISFAGGPATIDDFTEGSFPTSFSIADDAHEQIITFDPIHDTEVEFETLTGTISAPIANNGITPSIAVSSDQADIDDDAVLEIELTQDGTEDADNLQYTVKLTSNGVDNTNETGSDITADIDITGVDAADFENALPTDITIADGFGSTLVDLDIFDDVLIEGDEVVNAALSNPTTGVTISGTFDDVDGDIIDNDDGAVVEIEITHEQDGSEDGDNVQFRVNLVDANDNDIDLVNASGSDITVNIAFTNEAGSDDFNTAFPSTVTIPDGDGFFIVDLDVFDDFLIEEDETITATISSPSGASLATLTSADADVVDNDDDNVHLKIITTQDGIEGSDNVRYLVSLTDTDNDSGNTLENATGSAFTANLGYSGATQADFNTTLPPSISIGDGESTELLDLDALVDTSVEIETLTANLSGENHATVPVTVVIDEADADIDDDAVLEVAVTQNGNETGPQDIQFTVTLGDGEGVSYTNDSGSPITATMAFSGNAESTDITGGLVNAPISIPADGSSADVITLDVIDDALLEIDETITATISGASTGVTIGSDNSDDATLLDNDNATVTIDDGDNEEGNGVVMDVNISSAVEGDVVIDINFTNSTTEAGDFTSTSQQVTFSDGTTTTQQITVPTTEDDVFEGGEDFIATVSLNSGNSEVVATDTGTGTINDDDPISISIDDDSEDEGTDLVFTVTLSNESDTDIDIPYTTNNGTATTADSDYIDNDATLTITAGNTEGTITVETGDDDTFEGDETLTVNLTSSTQGSITDGIGAGTIEDEDPITITIDDDSEEEGTDLEFTVTLSNASDTDIDIPYTTNNGTATTADSDYTDNDATLTITAGNVEGTITIETGDDDTFEGDETLTVNLTSSTQGSITDGIGAGTIEDEDPITITIDDDSEEEGTDLVFTVTLSNASDTDIDIPYTTNNGTATTADSDYTDNDATLTITAGNVEGTITIETGDDDTFERDETLTVNLTSSTQGSITDGIGAGTIEDEDPITITIDDDSEEEGTDLVFTVTLSNASDTDIDIPYTTNNGTATTADSDYTDNDATLTITAGDTEGMITVETGDDDTFEEDETLTVNLTSSTQGSITDGIGAGTIEDEDPITITIGDDSEEEGADLVFTVTLSNASDTDIDIPYTTNNGTATTADSDYTDNDATLTITAGNTEGTITIETGDDDTFEEDETLTVNLTSSTQGGITDGIGAGTIEDEDPITIDIADDSENEGSNLEFVVSLSNASDEDLTVTYSTTDGSATTSDSDYTDNDGTVTFIAGQTERTITVTTGDDDVYEEDETINVTLSSPTQGTLDDGAAVGTIVDEDLFTISINDAAEEEGTSLVFSVTLSNESAFDTDIDFTTDDDVATLADNDYIDNDGTLTITAGETIGTITVQTIADEIFEGNEDLQVNLNTTSDGTFLDNVGIGTLTDEDPISITIDNVTEIEGTDLVFTVSLTHASAVDVLINYSTNDGTATTSNGDYIDNDNTLTIPANQTSGTITISTNKDELFESDETITVVLNNSNQGTIEVSTGLGTLLDDEEVDATLSVTQNGDEEGAVAIIYTVTLSIVNDTDAPITFDFEDLGSGTAIVGDDYEAVANGAQIIVEVGENTGSISIPVIDELLVEGDIDETVVGQISNVSNDDVTIDIALATATINDNDLNNPPVAVDDEGETDENTPVQVDMEDNDSDPDGDDLVYGELISEPMYGTVEISEDGILIYTPNEFIPETAFGVGDQAVDEFEYEVCDTREPILCTTAFVTIVINEVIDDAEVLNTVINTASGDPRYRRLRIRDIEDFPNNKVHIYNRWGNVVWETRGYHNDSNFFEGLSDGSGLLGTGGKLPVGTYFYVIDLGNGDLIKGFVRVQ